jgi:hypothetical protein
MKLIHTIPLVIAAACLTLAGCEKKTDTGAPGAKPAAVPDEKTALATFKADVESAGAWIEEKQKSASADPAAGLAMMGEIVLKLKAVRTDGLPADLKSAWGEMSAVLTEMGDIFKGIKIPKGDDKPEEAMKALGEIMPKMMALQAKVEPVAKKLEEVGKKYGLDMKKVAPGNK